MIPIRNILKKENAITSYRYKNNRIFIFKCNQCESELKVQQQYVPKHTGLCVRCAQYDKPFKACYTSLLKSAKNRNMEVNMSYDEYLDFTKITNCHYCNSRLEWLPHTTKDKKKAKEGRSYKLDRKNSLEGYSKDNCVVCCWRCNQSKGNRYTYEEWYGMTEYFRKKEELK